MQNLKLWNKHILTIIDQLTGWPEAFPILDKSADTIVFTFINQYLPVHMCPRYILSNNGTEFKNNLMDQVLNQLGIKRIFSAHYHPQSNGKLEVFQKYLKPTLKRLCEKGPSNWDKYISQVLPSYRVTPNLATAETPFFLVYRWDPNLPLHQLLEPMQWFWEIQTLEWSTLKLTGLPWLSLKRHWIKLLQNSSEDHGQTATLLQDQQQGYISKTSNPASWTWSGDQVTELSELSVMDTSYT